MRTNRRTLRVILLALVCAAVTMTLTVARASTSQVPSPTFRSGVQLVEVDVTVRDQKGHLVRDLTMDDFELVEDDARQEVASFRLVDLPIQMRSQKESRTVPAAPDVTSNASSGRVYVMLLDNPPGLAFTHVYLTQRSARRFVNEALAPDDLTAVIDMQSGSGSHGFTKSRQRLLDSIDRYGRAALGGVPRFGPELRHDLLSAYETLHYVAERLGAIGNRRKAIIWIGGVVPFHHPDAGAATAYRDAVRSAERHNVAVYPVDPHGLTNTLGRAELERVGALRAAAEDTGGYAVVNTNNFASGYRRIVEENSTYYVIGYYPAKDHQDGRFHPIRVRVKRPGVSVRARRGYTAPTPASTAAEREPLPAGLSFEAMDALRRVVAVDEVGLQVFAAPFLGGDGRGSVLLGVHLRGADVTLRGGNRLEISRLAIDSSGEIHAGMREVLTLDMPGEGRTEASPEGLRYFDRLELAPGRHEIRVSVHQPGGATGSVTTHVDVPDFPRERLTMSGLVISSANDTAAATLRHDEISQRALGGDPTMSRRFVRGDVMTIWAEAYLRRGASSAPMRITTNVSTAGGMIIVSRQQLSTPREASAPVTTHAYVDRVELSPLEPGEYVLRVEAATPDGRAKVSRQMPFLVE